MKRTVTLCLSLSAMVAGCSQPSPGENSPPLSSLASFAGCNFEYPDGRAIDCDLDMAGPTEEHIPESWTCIEVLNAGISRVALWSDRHGRMGIAYQLRTVEEGGIQVGRFAIDDGKNIQLVLAKLGPQGFVRFPQFVGERGHAMAVGHEFHAKGTPDGTLKVSTTLFQTEPWYVFNFEPTPSESYYFMTMSRFALGDEELWLPADNHTYSGPSYSLSFVSYEPLGSARFYYSENRVAGSALPTPGKDCPRF